MSSEKKHVTLSLTKEPYEEYQKLLEELKAIGDPAKSASREIDEFILKRLSELRNAPVQMDAKDNVEAKKRLHDRLYNDIIDLERKLRKVKVYDEMLSIVLDDLHYDNDGYTNYEAVVAEFLKICQARPKLSDHAQMFVRLMERNRERKTLEKALNMTLSRAT